MTETEKIAAMQAHGSALAMAARVRALESALMQAADWIASAADETDDAAGAVAFADNLRALAEGVYP